jgi:hypothetical protein
VSSPARTAGGGPPTRNRIVTTGSAVHLEKIELIEGRMFWTDEDRLNMLALLLENVGMGAAVRLGDTATC